MNNTAAGNTNVCNLSPAFAVCTWGYSQGSLQASVINHGVESQMLIESSSTIHNNGWKN